MIDLCRRLIRRILVTYRASKTKKAKESVIGSQVGIKEKTMDTGKHWVNLAIDPMTKDLDLEISSLAKERRMINNFVSLTNSLDSLLVSSDYTQSIKALDNLLLLNGQYIPAAAVGTWCDVVERMVKQHPKVFNLMYQERLHELAKVVSNNGESYETPAAAILAILAAYPGRSR